MTCRQTVRPDIDVDMNPLTEGGGESSHGRAAHDREGEQDEHGGGQELRVDEEDEGRTPKLIKVPVKPSKSEVEVHMTTHIPYRDWCPHCVRGRGLNDKHVKGRGSHGDDPHPTIGMDYGFLITKEFADTDDRDRQCGPMLVSKDLKHGMVLSMVVPEKGASSPWVPRRVAKWIDSLGYNKVIVKIDNEPAIKALGNEVKRLRGAIAETMLQHPEPHEKQSHGAAERAVGIIEGLVRTIKDGLEFKIKKSIKPCDNILLWLVEHVGQLYSRYNVGEDGRTPMERLRGRGMARPEFEFAERLLFMPLKPGRGGKFDPKFHFGIYLGRSGFSNEVVVGTEHGAVRVRTVRRLPEEDRWDAKFIESIVGTPWAPDGRGEDKPIGVKISLPEMTKEDERLAKTDIAAEPVVRRAYLRRSDFERHGFTDGCQGCRALQRGERAVMHWEKCRLRIENLIKNTEAGAARMQRAEYKMNEAIAKEIERVHGEADRKRRREQDRGGADHAGADQGVAEGSAGSASGDAQHTQACGTGGDSVDVEMASDDGKMQTEHQESRQGDPGAQRRPRDERDDVDHHGGDSEHERKKVRVLEFVDECSYKDEKVHILDFRDQEIPDLDIMLNHLKKIKPDLIVGGHLAGQGRPRGRRGGPARGLHGTAEQWEALHARAVPREEWQQARTTFVTHFLDKPVRC